MKKTLLLIGTLGTILLSAQDNSELSRNFQKQNDENQKKFDTYIKKRYGAGITLEKSKRILELKENLSGFFGGKPQFYEQDDQGQVFNNNVDMLTTAGNVAGLTGAFNGEGIKYTIFDGGRIFAAHTAFNNTQNRITNKEASSNPYSSHATGVGSIIGAKSSPLSVTQNGVQVNGNAKGVALNSSIDSYRFATTILPGNTNSSTIFQKIIASEPKISNHSYGNNPGWTYGSIQGGYPSNGWYYNGIYESGNNYDLMGTYFVNDQNYDAIVYNNPNYVIVKSAGNYFGYGPGYNGSTTDAYYDDGQAYSPYPTGTAPQVNCAQGYDCIGYGSLAKNIIVVGATNIIYANNFRYANASDVLKSDYSNAGPRDDGGIKPDISAPGTDIWMASTNDNATGGTTWTIGSGTSMSAPQVTGIIGLWMQIYKSLFNDAELSSYAAKTLMIHSALEAGSIGPDPWYGWGFINAKKGAELLVGKSNNSVIFKDEIKTSGTTNTINVKASGTEPLKVTIAWIDPEYKVPSNLTWENAHNNRTSRLVNDLDLRITDITNNTQTLPWKLNATSPMTPATKGDNTVDNVEQVIIENPVGGRLYKIEVTNKGTLVNNATTPAPAPQNYSIIVTGHSEVLGTLDAVKANKGIIISPTLTKDYVKVLKAPAKSTFKVVDLSGKLLNSGEIKGNEHSLDLSSYANGIYIIEINTGKEKISKKVIKE